MGSEKINLADKSDDIADAFDLSQRLIPCYLFNYIKTIKKGYKHGMEIYKKRL